MVESATPSWMLVGVQKNRGDGGEFILAWSIWVHRAWRWFYVMIMIFWCGVFESIAEDCGFKNKVLDILKLLHVIRNCMEMDSGRKTCWYTNIFNSTNQLLRWCSILGIFWLWTPTGGSTRPRCFKKVWNQLFEFKPRCFLENSVSQWLVNLIRSNSQAAGCGLIAINRHGSAGQDGIQFVLIKCEGVFSK